MKLKKNILFAGLTAAVMLFASCGSSPVEPDLGNGEEVGGNLITKVFVEDAFIATGEGWNKLLVKGSHITATDVETGNLSDFITVNTDSVTLTLPATNELYQSQVYVKTNARVKAGKYYEFSADVTSDVEINNKEVQQFKATNEVLTVPANNTTSVKYYANPTDAANYSIFFALGGLPAANIKIENIKLVEITKAEFDAATYVPEVDLTSVTNLIEGISIDETFFAVSDWTPKPESLTTSINNGKITYNMAEATTAQWKAQLKLAVTPTITVANGDNWVFGFKAKSSVAIDNVVTIKLISKGNDDAALTALRTYSISTTEGTIAIEGTSSIAISELYIVLDFGGAPAANVELSDFVFGIKE